MHAFRKILASVAFLVPALGLHATIGLGLQHQLGNPSGATTDPANRTNFLSPRAQYTLGYNDATREANWVAWNLTATDVGGSGRSDFSVDPLLPATFTAVLTTDYSGSGFDRGHMCPSGDRTVSAADNAITFYMSNMVPQAPDNNQGVWANFESYCRTLAAAGNELLIMSGPGGFAGSTLASGVSIPGFVWKIAVVVPLGPGTALSRITPSTRVIALKIPNIQGIRSTPWQNYLTSAAQLEADTGFTFFTDVPAPTASVLRTKIDGQTAVGSPSITTQPETQSAAVGGSVTFSVAATGDAPLAYQWLKDDAEIPGANGATYTVANVQAASAGNYVVTVTNAVGAVSSNIAALIVTGLPPLITTPLAPQTVPAGSNVTFTVGATGSPTLTYQWRKDTLPLPGATLASLTLTDVQAGNGGLYDVIVTNSVNSAASGPVLLTVTPAGPTIVTQPLAQTVTGGTVVTFTVGARGTAPLTYQWRKGGVPLADGGIVAGSGSATLTLTGVGAGDSGSYDVVVTNALNAAASASALLTVNAATITWNFGPDAAGATANPTSGLPVDVTGGTLTQGNNNGTTPLLTTTSVSPTASGFSGGVNAGAAARIGALNATQSAYFEFTLTPAAGRKLVVAGMTFGSRSTATGPQAYSIFSSFDNFATPVATGTLAANSSWALIAPAAFVPVTGTTGAAVTFRIFGHNGAGSPGAGTANWRIDDLRANVSTVAASSALAPAVVATTPTNGALGVAVTAPVSITFNQPVLINGPWFTLNSALHGPLAATVTGGPTTFTLSPPANFAFGDTVTVTVLAGQVRDKDTGTLALPANFVFAFGTGLPVKPTIVTQPLPRTVSDGGSATFSIAVTGTAPFTYQWRKDGMPILGNASATTATLNLVSLTVADTSSIDCVVTNAAGSAMSDAVALTVLPVAPAITIQPIGVTAALGGNASFTVTATGSAPLSYAWRFNGAPLANGIGISGVATPTLTLTGVQAGSVGQYDVVVTNLVSSVTSQAVSLGVTAAALSPITWDFATAAPSSGLPATLTGGVVTQGNNNGTTTLLTAVSVSPTASGFSGGSNAGAAARTGALNPATSAYFQFTLTPSAGRQVVATALRFGSRSTGTGPQAFAVFTSVDNFTQPIATGTLSANSSWAALTPAFAGVRGPTGVAVTFRIFGYNGTGSPGTGTANWRIDDLRLTAGTEQPPTIVISPAAQTATVGDTVTFQLVADGTAPLSYQWRKDGTPIVGHASARTAALTLTGVLTGDAGSFDCVVSNFAGAAVSAAALLTVNKAPATVTLADLRQSYDGLPKPVSAVTTPAGLKVVITYNGETAAPIGPGQFAVVATVDDVNYSGSATGTLVIGTTVQVRHAPMVNGGIDGSLHVLLPEDIALSGAAWISGDLLVPGTPELRINGQPTYVGVKDGTGSADPTMHRVTLGGQSVVRYLIRRTDPVPMPIVNSPALPAGTRHVVLSSAGDEAGDFATLRNLTLTGGAGARVLPPGVYGTILVNGATELVLGVAGATEPAVYELESLIANGQSRVTVLGPVLLHLGKALVGQGARIGAADAGWLTVNVATGGMTLGGGSELRGFVVAPNGSVTLSGDSLLVGAVISDRLVLNGTSRVEAVQD